MADFGAAVALIGPGIDPDHEGLAVSIIGDVGLVRAGRIGDEDNGHGTYSAGTVAAIDHESTSRVSIRDFAATHLTAMLAAASMTSVLLGAFRPHAEWNVRASTWDALVRLLPSDQAGAVSGAAAPAAQPRVREFARRRRGPCR